MLTAFSQPLDSKSSLAELPGRIRSRIRGMEGTIGYFLREITRYQRRFHSWYKLLTLVFIALALTALFKVEACELVRLTSILLTESDT
jgi:hypothetical protein